MLIRKRDGKTDISKGFLSRYSIGGRFIYSLKSGGGKPVTYISETRITISDFFLRASLLPQRRNCPKGERAVPNPTGCSIPQSASYFSCLWAHLFPLRPTRSSRQAKGLPIIWLKNNQPLLRECGLIIFLCFCLP